MEKVGLVLSGGAAYGFAHIGVIKTLIKNNIPIDIVAGTSMGALIGGLFSAGVSIGEMEKLLETFQRRHIVDFNPFVLTDTGLLHGKKVVDLLRKMVGDKKIEDCEKKYCAVSANLCNGKQVNFKKGDLVTAIRASISIPGIFKPVKIDNMCLVDGGTVNNLPVTEARKMGSKKVIAVDVCSFYKPQNNLKTAVDMLISAGNMLTANIVKCQQDKGDIYIKIDQPEVVCDRFTPELAKKSIAYGEKYAKKYIPKIKEALGIN